MASNLRNPAPSHLVYAPVHNATATSIPPFLTACATNSIATALQLASTHEAGTVTFGLNRAVQAGHFALAGQLRGLGAQWDAFTVTRAGMTFAGVKWLVEGGYAVNSSVIGGGGLLGIGVSRNDSGCIRYLLDRGARPELGPPLIAHGPLQALRAEPNSYWTLNRAAAVCSVEIFALLLAHGQI